jgi:hypothetical protein
MAREALFASDLRPQTSEFKYAFFGWNGRREIGEILQRGRVSAVLSGTGTGVLPVTLSVAVCPLLNSEFVLFAVFLLVEKLTKIYLLLLQFAYRVLLCRCRHVQARW